MNWNALLNSITSWATNTGIKILVALVIMFISFKLINFLMKKIKQLCSRKHADKTIVNTMSYVTRIALKCLVVVCLIGYLGIDTSGITALITSLGVCVGLAINGALSNLAGGVLIIVTRPFKVDDFIEAQGVSGTVANIHMTNTKIITPDNKVVYVPNGTLANNNIINYSEKNTRRVDLDFSISYDSDPEKAKALIMDIIASHKLILSDPEPFVRVGSHDDSSLCIKCRVWTATEDYWTVHFDLLESVKASFTANGIEIPYNQIDVHIKKD